MKFGSALRNTIAQWVGFNLILALLPFWTMLLFSYFTERTDTLHWVLNSGALLLYATTLSSGVLFDRWNAMRFLASAGHDYPRRLTSEFFLTEATPLMVILLSITAFTALSLKEIVSGRLVIIQITVVLAALVASLNHSIAIMQRFELSRE